MKTFTDNAGRTWTVAINVAAVKRVRGLLGVNLYGLIDDKFAGLAKLLADPCDLVDVLYVLCKDEADAKGVTDVDFGRAMAGDAIDHATDAFLAEFTDFFPDPRVRAGLSTVIAKGRIVRDRMMDRMTATLETIDPAAVAETLIGSSGNAPASSGSTRGRSRSANSS